MHLEWLHPAGDACIATYGKYRAVIVKRDNEWTPRIENGEVFYPAKLSFHALAGAQAWAERKLADLEQGSAE